jgi:hypothetical protein
VSQRAEIETSDEPAAFEVGERWALSHHGASMEVDPRHGARICSFSLNGKDILTGPGVDPENYGSTFWTSPQSDWGWPPIVEIDSGQYAVVESETGLVCASSFSSKLGVIVTKRFSVVPGRERFRVEYEISNQSSDTLRLAPWEVTRVPGGLSLFRTGEPVVQPKSHPTLPVQEQAGVSWFDYKRSDITEDQKLFAHSSAGWLAHVQDGLVLMKISDPVPADKQAPGEAMVEIFASGAKDYIELEQQGAYTKVGPWKSLTWRVHWLLFELPEGVSAEVGDPELLSAIEARL